MYVCMYVCMYVRYVCFRTFDDDMVKENAFLNGNNTPKAIKEKGGHSTKGKKRKSNRSSQKKSVKRNEKESCTRKRKRVTRGNPRPTGNVDIAERNPIKNDGMNEILAKQKDDRGEKRKKVVCGGSKGIRMQGREDESTSDRKEKKKNKNKNKNKKEEEEERQQLFTLSDDSISENGDGKELRFIENQMIDQKATDEATTTFSERVKPK